MTPAEEDEIEAELKKNETTASITSTIMLKIPAENMSVLKEDFMESKIGLNMNAFLIAVTSAMNMGDDTKALLIMVADLIDFFDLVDINGDGYMEWEEFVMFILDAVVKEPEIIQDERFDIVETRVVQSASVRDSIVCSIMVPSLGKLITGVGPIIQIYGTDDKIKPSNTHLIYKFPIIGANNNENTMKGGKHLTIVHMQYLEGQEVLAVLRSDMYIEFFKFQSRSNYSVETIESLGKLPMNKPCHKIVFRVFPNRKPRLLVIGTSPVIDSYLFVPMGSNGLASLSDHQTMSMHTDYVRDIITINDGPSRFIVSASLDKSVMFWDLVSMEFKFKRTGHTAGVESLAYGGKCLLFAGGYDYSILVWDVTAAINRPLFALRGGHLSSVVRIVGLESIERCASLDESGVLVWWDISRSILGDNRMIDSTTCPEDHAYSFDVISELPHFYEALHGVIFLVAGRRQHAFKLKDVSTHEAAPVCTIYSSTLLSVFTVHSHEIIYWNVITGDQYKVVKELVSVNDKITCATLDDRGRRIIVGDTSGTVRYYNGLNGVLIKVLDSIGVPIKQLVYSPDKNLMIISENSDVIIIDDTIDITLPGVDYALRSVHFTSGGSLSDIVSVSYSYALGLFATVDSLGLLIIWEYLFMTPKFMIANVSGNSAEVGSIAFIGDFPLLLISDNSKNFSVLTFETNSGSNKKQQLWRLESVLPVLEGVCVEEEVDGEMKNIGARAKPYGDGAVRKYLREGGEAKHMIIHFEEDEEEDEEEGSKAASLVTQGSRVAEVVDSFSIQPKIPQSTFPKNLSVRVVCGYDDGTLCITNLTTALRKINIGKYITEDHVREQLIYNPKGRCVKYIGESDCRKILPDATIKSMEKFSTCTVECVKDCHRAAVTSIGLVGGFQLILTASEDKCVMLWDIDGNYRGLLTRGSEMDKLFKKHWNNPEDMVTRNQMRAENASTTVEALDLAEAAKERIAKNERKIASERLLQTGALLSSSSALMGNRNKSVLHNSTLTDPRYLTRALQNEALGGSGLLPVTSDTIHKSLRMVEKYPDRSRLLCQLDDQMTYEPSKKDVTRLQLQASASMPRLASTNGTTKKNTLKKTKKRKPSSSSVVSMATDKRTSMNQKYLQTIKIADQCLAQNSEERRKADASAKLGKWHYANEIAEIDAQDPGNWEISSLNRLREMYANMHEQMAKGGHVSNDREKIILQKLKGLCPGGDVPAYFSTLKSTYRARMKRKQKQKEGSGVGHTEIKASGEYAVFDVRHGQLVAVLKGQEGKRKEGRGGEGGESEGKEVIEDGEGDGDGDDEDEVAFRTSDYDENFVAKQGILADDGGSGEHEQRSYGSGSRSEVVDVVPISAMLDVSLSCDDNESLMSGQSDYSAGRSKRLLESHSSLLGGEAKQQSVLSRSQIVTSRERRSPSKQGEERSSGGEGEGEGVVGGGSGLAVTSPLCITPVPEPLSPGKRQLKKSGNTSPSRYMQIQMSSFQTCDRSPSPPLPLPPSTTLLDPPDFLAEVARQRTNDLVKDFELKMKLTEKKARKTSRQTRKKTRISKRAIKGATAALMDSARYLTDPLEISDQKSADFVNEELFSKWGHKARVMMQGVTTQKKKAATSTFVAMPSMKDITRMLYRTSSSIAIDFDVQQRREAILLARKSFGPYITSELVQVFEVFKSFPKQHPGPEDTVLMAGTNEADEMGDGLTTNPVYGCIDLADLVKHRFMRNRPHFKSFLDKLLIMQRPNMSAGMFITLNRTIMQICPLISRKDRRELIEFFKVYRSAEQPLKEGVERIYDAEYKAQLKKVFDFFDVDHSGSIDRAEIREVLDRTYDLRMKDHQELVGNEEEAEHNIDDNSISTIMTEASSRKSLDKLKNTLMERSMSLSLAGSSVDEEECETMDFPEFLKLFGQSLLP